jgi:hypothetical protein
MLETVLTRWPLRSIRLAPSPSSILCLAGPKEENGHKTLIATVSINVSARERDFSFSG